MSEASGAADGWDPGQGKPSTNQHPHSSTWLQTARGAQGSQITNMDGC